VNSKKARNLQSHQEQTLHCDVCGNPLLSRRVVFRCQCRALVHAYCWEKHVIQFHVPSFTRGRANLDSEFVPEKSETEEDRGLMGKTGHH
jgi:hypothetical protein